MTVIRIVRSGEYADHTAGPGKTRHGSDVRGRDALGDSLEPVYDPFGEQHVFRRIGIGKPTIAKAAELARRRGTTIEQELLCELGIQEAAYYEALARDAGLAYVDAVSPSNVSDIRGLDTQLITPQYLRVFHPQASTVTAIVPEARKMDHLIGRLRELPQLADLLVVTRPSSLRRAVWQAGEKRRVAAAVSHLFEERPKFSARIVMSGGQGFWLGLCLSAIVTASMLASSIVLNVLHSTFSLLYFSALCLRIASLGHAMRQVGAAPTSAEEVLPTYTVMVALYREAAVAPQLLRALDRLDWPKSRLDIKLLCEADDLETIEALKALKPGRQYEIVEVPDFGPRTKPKALSYALCAARGRYIVVYDAEDRPHRGQLKEAHARFTALPEDLACLQAPLIITNGNRCFLSALFALEYAAQFRGLLPFLARLRMPIPLGGTSNHFRTDILRRIGGWDPFNVTEDADLGMRLHRLGYRTGVLRHHTLEDAPVDLSVWMRQRTRWFKGWLQTWLVVTRDNREARAEMGWKGFVVFQLLFGGVIVSALLHPALVVALIQSCMFMLETPKPPISALQIILIVVDLLNVMGSYAVFIALGVSPMMPQEKQRIGMRWIGVPVYWMMITIAAWRAVFELRRNPFFWHKTPHSPAAQEQVRRQRWWSRRWKPSLWSG